MISPEICKEQILSEDYRDFVVNNSRALPIPGLAEETLCLQNAGFGYQCYYISSRRVQSITAERFSYTAIPKCYTPLSMDSLNQAGISPLHNYPGLQLRGEGVLIGFLDSGIDYQTPIFRNADGTTRIAAIWDQTIQSGTPPENFAYGSEYTAETINAALNTDTPLELVPSVDETGHGTYTASLAAGSENPSENFLGAAPECTLAVVKLKQAKQYLKDYYFIPDEAECYQETDIILALHYLDLLAERLQLPLVYCVTLGTNSGGHVGALPCGVLLNLYGNSTNRIPVIACGNEADKRHHYYHEFQDSRQAHTVELRVGENIPGFTMELWTSIPNIITISLTSPYGESTSTLPIRANSRTEFQFLLEQTKIAVDYRLIVERENSELIFFRFTDPSPGIWRIVVEPVRIFDGRFHIWLPISEFISGELYFLESNPDFTITNPANGTATINTAFYDGNTNSVALSSGRGYNRQDRINPSLAAPGVQVTGALPNGIYVARSGSSAAAAITAGAVALLLEWLLLELGNPLIDSMQIKSLLTIGAIRPPEMDFPNREWGYGLLNLYNTFDEIRKF